MNRARDTFVDLLSGAGLLLASGARNVAHHWALSLFSLVAAFAVWMLIQDVENPRVDGEAPASGGIQVRVVNLADDCIVEDIGTVRVAVNAREGELEELRPSDFTAQVDLRDARCSATPQDLSRPVTVESRRGDVDVISPIPPVVDFQLVQAAVREVPVTVRVTGQVPQGYQIAGGTLPDPEPAIVTIRGRRELVDSVASIDLDADLSNARGTTPVARDLVARTAAGSTVQVTIAPARATATFEIEPVFSVRAVPVKANITGTPAAGFKLTNITVDPITVQATGEKAIIDGLQGALQLEPHDITGQRTSITVPKNIERVQGITTDRQTVTLHVEIEPIVCGPEAGADCLPVPVFVVPQFTGTPAGIVVQGGPYTVEVRVSGPLAQINDLQASQITATVSLASATAGVTEVTPAVVGPAGTDLIFQAQPLSVSLAPEAAELP